MKTAEEFFGTAPQPIQWADRSGRTAPATQAPLPIKLPEGSMLPPDLEIRQVLTETAERHKINPALLMAMAQQESGYNPNATGPETQWGTAKGMFQFLDSTAQGKGIDPLDWKQAAEAAADDLARGIATKGTDWAIAHHFAGPDPKQHGPKTARYTQEVLAKANAIARELGIEFHLPEAAKADFSQVTGGVNDAHLPSADDFFSGNAQPASAAQPTSDGPEDFRTTANRVIAEAAPNTMPGMNPLPEMAIRAAGRTIARGWEGIKNALNRDTETVEYSDEELRREWDTNRTVRNTALEQGMGFAQWAEQNRTRTVSTKPFAQEEAEWAERLKENPEDAYLLPKRLSHLRPQADDSNFAPAGTFQGIAQRFISNAKNPIDLFLQDSIPADLVTALFSMPELERKKFDQARQISQAFDIVNSDETKSSEEMEMAEEVLSDWRRRTDQSIAEAWSEMWQAAKEDPSGIGVALYEAIAADPYMAAAPMGTGVIKPMRAVNAARVARSGVPRSSIARRAETVIDRFADAGTLAASLNVAAGAADNLSMEGRINDPEVKLNAAMGYALGGPLGVVFMRGARARAKGLDRAKLDGTLEETLRDMAKADVETEAQATNLYRSYPDGYGVGDLQTPTQTRIAEMLGIQRHKDAAEWKKQRRKEIKDAFGDNPEYADYQRYVAEERIARAQQLSEEAEAKRRSAAEAAYGRSVEDPAARAARYQAEYDDALEARNAAAEGDLMARAQADDAAWEAAQKLNAEELFYAELSRDHPTIRQTEAKIRRRNDHLGRASISLQRDPLKNTKALNDRGRPLRLYHGTKEKFDKFDIGRAGSSKDAGWLGRGIYFTDQPITAKFYSQAAGAESPAVIEAYADIRNPFMWGKKTRGVDNLPDEIKSDVISLVGRSPTEDALADGITQVLRDKGYDGVIAETTGTSLDTPAKEVVVFSPQQVVRRVKNKYVRGEASPEMLARLGVVAGGAGAAFLAFPEDQKLQGTFLGGLAGLLVPGIGGSVLSRMKQAGAISPEGDIISALVRRGKMANKLEEAEITARDNAWIDAARQGDQEAFRYLYETYVGDITRYAKRFEEGSGIRAGVEAEDLAQEAFAAVFKRLAEDPELTFDPNFISYMQRAVRNQAISTVRAQGRLKRKADVVQESQHFREDLYEGDTGSARSVLDETTGVDDYSGETIIDNVDQTPESVAIRNDMLDIIRQELDNQSEQARRLFTMTELEHYTLAEAAEQLGMSREAAYKAVQRSKQGIKNAIEQNRLKFGEPVTEETIRGPRSQRGSADPEALRGMAVVAATATAAGTAGYFFTDGDLWKTGVFTTLATPAALMLGGKFRGGTGNVIKGELKGTNRMAAAIRSIDYRLKDMGEAIYGLAKKHGHDELKHIKAYNDATAGFINTFSRLPKDIKPIVIKALSTRDKKVIDKILTETGGSKFVREFDQVRKVLDDIEDQLVGYGLIKKSEKDYFPFRVKDLDGLKKALGQEATAEIDAALVKAERKMQKSQQRPLTEIEKSLVINKVLEPYLGKPISAHTPGFAKARTIQVIDENLQPFYHDPVATLNSYGVQAIKYIERAKFFGRHLKKTKNSEGNYAVNIGDSIGELVQDLRTRGQINESQAVELASMLQDRFNGGEMASNHLVQGTKNLTNAALLGHIASAIVQLGDIAIQASRQGVIPSVKALRRQLMRDKLVDLKNYGMTEHIAHEFLSDGWTRKVADWSFKWGGFRAIDHIGKDFGLNAAIERMFSEAKTPQGIMRLSDRFQRVFPDDFDKALTALKKGQVNESVELMAFSELTRTQPITSWELPQMYHRMPNGRMIYHLQTFSLRVLNMVHEDALKDMMSLNPKRIAKGTKNLLTIGTILGVQGVAADKLKDFVAGKPVELEWEEVPLNALAALGMNMYDYNRMADKGPIAGVAEGKLPPIIRMSQQVWEDPERSVRFIPVAGRVAHDRGRDYFEQRRRERRKRQGYKMEITVPPSEGSSNRRDSRRDSRRSNRRDDRRR